jgi:hypothetical protein
MSEQKGEKQAKNGPNKKHLKFHANHNSEASLTRHHSPIHNTWSHLASTNQYNQNILSSHCYIVKIIQHCNVAISLMNSDCFFCPIQQQSDKIPKNLVLRCCALWRYKDSSKENKTNGRFTFPENPLPRSLQSYERRTVWNTF